MASVVMCSDSCAVILAKNGRKISRFPSFQKSISRQLSQL